MLEAVRERGVMVVVAGLVAMGAPVPAAFAADIADPTPEYVEQAAIAQEWSFSIAPYFWAAGMSGSAGVFGLPPQDFDVSFSDILENLDFALMAAGEARYGPWSLGFDFMYSDLGASVATPRGILADEVDIGTTLLVATAVGGYALWSDDRAHLDVFAGARLWSADTDFAFDGGVLDGRSRSDGATWVDPVIGVRGRIDLGDTSFFLAGWGLIGGFGVGSDFTWDAMASVGYDFTDSFSMTVGYRGLGVDYSDDGYVLDITQHGPILGAMFQF
jgi:hypothetical protein